MAYEFVDPPRGLSYAAPAVDFGILGDLPDTYRKAQQDRFKIQDQQRQAAVADAFKNQQLPLDPATGLPDYGKIMQVLASKGGVDAITRLAPAATDQVIINQGQQTSPLLGGPATPSPPVAGAASPSPGPGVSAAPQSLPAPSAAAPSPSYRPMQNAPNSVATIVQTALPADSAGPVIANMAKSLGVEPEAALTPEQEQALTRRLGAYVSRTGGARTAQAAPAAPPALTADALLQSPQAQAAQAAQPASPNDRVSGAFSALPVPPNAQASAAPQPQPQATAPEGDHRITPAEPLSPGFTDWQKNVTALEAEAARRSRFNPTEGKALLEKAQRIRDSYTPFKMGQYDTYISPATGQTVAQGPMAKILSGGAGGINAATIDADAERYRQTGQLPPNMGRGIQGQQEAAAIRARAVEHEVAAGGDPNKWPTRWQEYRATGIGLNAGSRVRATREENLNLILKVTESAIPAALEQSQKVWRGGFVPLNKIIQRGQVMTSDPELRAFGMANLQLAEGWARAMNPTGVMRESDREKALEFLTTADSPETYRRLVNQLKTQITRERDSIRSGAPMREGDTAPLPGVRSAAGGGDVVRWETGPDGSLRKAQ